MHATEITSQPRQMVDTDRIDQSLDAAVEAAARRGMPVETWLARAVIAQIAEDESLRHAMVEAPGPWPGWSARTAPDGKYPVYTSTNRCEVSFLPSINKRWHMTDLRRPWSARTYEAPLVDALGRVRTFATADAAKKALLKAEGSKLYRADDE